MLGLFEEFLTPMPQIPEIPIQISSQISTGLVVDILERAHKCRQIMQLKSPIILNASQPTFKL